MSYAFHGNSFAIVPPTSAAPSARERRERVLVVDDEESVRSVFSDCLGLRHHCSAAANTDEALALLAANHYALVVTDINMPGRSGTELLREVVARYPDTAVIIISGVDRTQRVLDALRLGASDYLLKPCDLDVLELSVDRALERRALLSQARSYNEDLERRNAELAKRKAELERLQAQIVHSEKMASLGQLAAGVAHELNNPAGFIYGNMDVLAQSVAALERLLRFYDTAPLAAGVAERVKNLKEEICYQETLEDLGSIIADCRNGAERIRDIVQNLRTFSRLDEAEFKKIDLHEGIDSTVRLLSRYYSGDRLILRRDYGQLPLVDCYAGQLNQVWMNLLANAAQSMGGKSGEVAIRTWMENQMAMVAITDRGDGIASEHLKKIFDPFFTTKPVGEGTGLGLSITHTIIQRHGGSINVKTRPGHGTTFTVGVPVEAKHRSNPRQ